MPVVHYSKYRQVNLPTSYDGRSQFDLPEDVYNVTDINGRIVVSIGKLATGKYGLLIVSGNIEITGPGGEIYMENGRITAQGITTSGLSAISAILGDVVVGGSGLGNGSISVYDSNNILCAKLDSNGIYGIAGIIGGFVLGANTLTAGTNNIILDSQNKAISINNATFGAAGIQAQYNSGTPRFYCGDGLTKYFKFDGTIPSFGGGILNESIFEIDTSAILRTSSTVGDGSASSAGILINKDALYACEANQDLVDANVKIDIAGTIFAKKGLLANWLIDDTKIYNSNAYLSSLGFVSFGTTPPTAVGYNVGAYLGSVETKKTITSYTITPRTTGTTACSKNWTLQGSNDGSAWDTLDTQTDITDWVASTPKTFNIASPASYRFYKLDVTANNGSASYLAIGEIELIAGGVDQVPAMTSNCLPAPINITTSTNYASGTPPTYAGWKAFDDAAPSSTSAWITVSGTTTGWITVDFGGGSQLSLYQDADNFLIWDNYLTIKTPFVSLDASGYLTVTNITASGVITITSGGAGGWTLSSTSIYSTSSTRSIRGVSTALLSNDSGFFIQGDGKVRFGTVVDGVLSEGIYNDNTDVWIKSKDDKIFFKDPNSLMEYKIGTGNNLLRDHNFEMLQTDNPYEVTILTESTYKEMATATTQRFAQSFSHTRTGSGVGFYNDICAVGLLVESVPVGKNITIRIETDNAGSPSGVLADAHLTGAFTIRKIVGKSTKTDDIGGTDYKYFWTEFDFEVPSPLATGKYWIVWYSTDVGGANELRFAHSNTTSIYASNESKYSANSGTTWTAYHANAPDFAFFVKTEWDDAMAGESPDVFSYNFNFMAYDTYSPSSTGYCYWDERQWNAVGLPRVYSARDVPWTFFIEGIMAGMGGAADYFLLSDKIIFDRQTAIINSTSYFDTKMDIAPSIIGVITAHVAPRGGDSGSFYGNTVGASLGAVITTYYYDDTGALLSSETTTTTFDAVYAAVDKQKVYRIKHAFTTPADTMIMKVEIKGASTEWIRLDGAKLEGGSTPSSYNAESALWEHNWGGGSDGGFANTHPPNSISDYMLESNVAAYSYTPTITAPGGTVPTYGAVATGKYWVIGKRCFMEFALQNGAGGTAGAGAVTLYFSLPVSAKVDIMGVYDLCGGLVWYNGAGQTPCMVGIYDSTHGYFKKYDTANLVAADQNNAIRQLNAYLNYEIE